MTSVVEGIQAAIFLKLGGASSQVSFSGASPKGLDDRFEMAWDDRLLENRPITRGYWPTS